MNKEQFRYIRNLIIYCTSFLFLMMSAYMTSLSGGSNILALIENGLAILMIIFILIMLIKGD